MFKLQEAYDKEGDNKLIVNETEEPYEDLSEYNFRKFAATYFIANVNHQYSKRPLKGSLLDLPTAMDVVAAQALWITVLRFMGDLPEPRYLSESELKPVDNTTIMTKITKTLSRNFVNSKEYKVRLYSYLFYINCVQNLVIYRKLQHKIKLNRRK